eukprot:symbB.v1.2.020521.t1/scaffold1734.1/size154044/6
MPLKTLTKRSKKSESRFRRLRRRPENCEACERLVNCQFIVFQAKHWVAQTSTNPTAKARAMQALKRKKQLEQQRDQLVNTQFNVENMAIQQDQAELTAQTMQAMKEAAANLKEKQKQMGVEDVDKLTDDIADVQAEMKEIQAALAATSGLDTGATDEAEAELQALYAQQSQKEAEEAMAILAGGGGVPAPTPATPAGYVAPAAKAAPLAA